MEDIWCGGHVRKAEAELPTRRSRSKPRWVWQAGWLAGASQAGWPRREAVKRRAATARERVEAAKMGVKKRVNLRVKYAVRRGNIVMAVVVVVDGLRRV